VAADSLALGDSLVITFQATMNATAEYDETIPNFATVDWDSHPDENEERAGTQESDGASITNTLEPAAAPELEMLK
ncbi:MAG: hypothetical protein GTO22_10920, partial [Gemmatimonadales bacterium]|nr:hypothetical protein [Gemmatimonadales bacterium]